MVRSRRHVLSAAASLATASAAAVLVAAPAFAASPATTSLKLTAAKSSVAAKSSDTFTGTLSSGKTALKGQSVQLEEKAGSAKSFAKVGKPATTNAKGQVSFSVVPSGAKGQKDEFELFYTASKSYAASHSNIVTVTLT